MKKQPHSPPLKIHRFDSTAIRAVYPGMATFQLAPGPIEGWIQSVPLGDLCINAGTLSRATLYDGHFTPGMINIGFILNPDTTAVVYGHEYDAGTLAIDVGDMPIHEIFPPHMIWVGIHCPKSFLREELKRYPEVLQSSRHLTLMGPREQLRPLIQLTQQALRQKTGIRGPAAEQMSTRFQKAIHELLALRLEGSAHELPYAEGNKFLMHVVRISHQLATEAPRRRLGMKEITQVTGMKSRTLQKYFHTLYGMGPTEYFRIRRLNQVRADLMKAPSSTTIQEVAHQWGFTHMGRLSLQYKRLFGESPSETRTQSRFQNSP